MMKTYQLSLPGPTEYNPLVLQELMRPNLPHYGDLWMAFYRQCLEKLRKVYRTKNSVYILPCSGSGAVEATFASLGAKKGLFLNNGTFGQRILSIGQRHLKKAEQIEKALGIAATARNWRTVCKVIALAET